MSRAVGPHADRVGRVGPARRALVHERHAREELALAQRPLRVEVPVAEDLDALVHLADREPRDERSGWLPTRRERLPDEDDVGDGLHGDEVAGGVDTAAAAVGIRPLGGGERLLIGGEQRLAGREDERRPAHDREHRRVRGPLPEQRAHRRRGERHERDPCPHEDKKRQNFPGVKLGEAFP